jgi:hypothetical protein
MVPVHIAARVGVSSTPDVDGLGTGATCLHARAMTTFGPGLARRPVARVSGPGDLVATVPVLVGFEPQHSIVALVLRRSQVALTMRVDLPPPGERRAWKVLADTVVRAARQADGSAVVLVVYSSDRWHTDASRAVVTALRHRGIEVLDVLAVHDGRWWSATCHDPACCPPQGTPVPETSAARIAAAVVDGRVVRPDRASLAEEFAPPPDLDPAAVTKALDAARAELPPAGPGRLPAVEALLTEAAAAARAGALSLSTAALLAQVVRDGDCRDEAYRHLVRAPRPHSRALWASCCRLLTPPALVVPLALFALVAYLEGDGAVANLALERAEQVDPQHPTVRLVSDVVASALAPSVVIGALARSVQA